MNGNFSKVDELEQSLKAMKRMVESLAKSEKEVYPLIMANAQAIAKIDAKIGHLMGRTMECEVGTLPT
jgi:hypothetical protein